MINYPIFTLRKKPYKILYTKSKILVKREKSSHLETLDDKDYGGDYFMRLIQIDKRIKFDYTCGGLQDLMLSKSKWGIDSKAKVHELPKFTGTKKEIRKVVRAAKNFVWVKYISYPFKIKTVQNISNDIENLSAEIIKIDNKWYIKRFIDNETDQSW